MFKMSLVQARRRQPVRKKSGKLAGFYGLTGLSTWGRYVELLGELAEIELADVFVARHRQPCGC